MAFNSDDIGLLFKCRGSTEEARAAFSQLRSKITADIEATKTAGVGHFNELSSSAENLQKGFRGLASEASNIVGEFTGDRLTGATSQITSFAGALGAIPGPAGLAVGAIAGIVTAAVGAAAGLLELLHKAADTGEEFHTFQLVTGLTAEGVSTLNYYVGLTGHTLGDITLPMKTFTTLLADARDGTAKASAAVQRLGITDLSNVATAFDQAVKHINGTTDAIERTKDMTLAFGSRGIAVMTPLLDKMNGGFLDAEKNARELGVTLSQDDIEAAENFNKAFKKVELQLGIIIDKFALAYGPQVTKALDDVSSSLAKNQEHWEFWGHAVGDIFAVLGPIVKTYLDFWAMNIVLIEKGLSSISRIRLSDTSKTGRFGLEIGPGALQPAMGGEVNLTPPMAVPGPKDTDTGGGDSAAKKRADDQKRQQAQLLASHIAFLKQLQTSTEDGLKSLELQWEKQYSAGLQSSDAYHKAIYDLEEKYRKDGLDAIDAEYAQKKQKAGLNADDLATLDLQENAEKTKLVNASTAREEAADKKITDTARQAYEDKTAYFDAEAKKRLAIAQEYAKVEGKTDADIAAFQRFLAEDTIEYRINALKAYLKTTKEGSDAQKKALNELKLLEIDLETTRANNAVADKKDRDEKLKSWNEYVQKIEEAQDKEDELQEKIDQHERDRIKSQIDAASVTHGGGLGEGIGKGLGVSLVSIFGDKNVIKSQGDFIKDVYSDVANAAGSAIGSMIDGLSQLVTQWITTGKFSAKAALQMAAGIALSLAMQAGVKAIFELADGWAAAASAAAMWWNPPAAAAYSMAAGMHFTAAGIYGTVAGVAAAAGVGLGLGSRALGGNQAVNQQNSGAFGSTGNGSGTGTVNQNPATYSRASSNFFQSSRDQHMASLAAAINAHTQILADVGQTVVDLHNKITGMPAHEVITRASIQRPGIVGNQVVADIKAKSSIGTNILKHSGIKK